MPPEFRTSESYIPALDGWRAVAILLVLWSHSSAWTDRLPFDLGVCGVLIFFVLSGFLITERLLTQYSSGTGIDLRSFYICRAFRILPPVILYLGVIAILGYGLRLFPLWKWEIFGTALFTRNYLPVPLPGHGLHGWFTGHFWSLAVEEHYYMLWPGVLALLGKKRAAGLAALGVLVVAAWRWIAWNEGITTSGPVLGQVPFFFRTDVRFDALLLGSLIGISFTSPEIRRKFAALLPARDTLPVLVLYVWVTFTMFQFGGLPAILLVAALLSITVLHPEAHLAVFLERWPLLRRIGRMSYSLYIWQQLFLAPANAGRPLGPLNWFPLNLVATFTVAALSYYVIERPMIRLGYKLARAGPQPASRALTLAAESPPR